MLVQPILLPESEPPDQRCTECPPGCDAIVQDLQVLGVFIVVA